MRVNSVLKTYTVNPCLMTVIEPGIMVVNCSGHHVMTAHGFITFYAAVFKQTPWWLNKHGGH